MPASKTEQVLEALKALLETVPGATVERNSGDGALPGGRTVFPGVHALSGASERGKKGSGLSAAGISSRAEGPNTAAPAATTTCPAPGAMPEPTDSAAPVASTP
jgi:hypothetical protein